MVRRKEPEENKPTPPARSIKVGKPSEQRVKAGRPAPVVHEDVDATTGNAKPLRSPRRRGNVKRIFWASILVIALLAIGWFGARLVINAMSNDGGFANLFNFGGTKLKGEEENQVNILLFGNPGTATHEGPNLTDTIMVASYNPEAQFLHLFSVPRDLWVTVPSYGGTRINTVYQIGGVGEEGAELLSNTLGEMLGIDIPYYMRIDFEGFEQMVDELGGVQVEVKKDLYDPLYPTENKGYQTLDIKAGTYTMGGDMALKYARSRETTSDFDRARRQQEIILALRQKAMDLDLLTAPSKMFAITDILADHLSTNLSKEELTRLMKLLTEFESGNVSNKVFDDSADGLLYATRVNEAFVLKPVNDDYGKLADFVAAALSEQTPSEEEPVVEETVEPLNIEVLNGTNVTGLAGKMATKLKEGGMNIVRVGNNPTRGVAKTTIYDNTNGAKASAVRKLMEMTGATLSTEKLTLPTSIDVRVVVGTEAEAALQ